MELSHHTPKEIYKAVIRSQHCQRNWDLSKTIPKEDIEILIDCATQCPSKQNIAFYKLHFITSRDLIEDIHNNTWGAGPIKDKNYPTEYETNPQTLANLLVVFESVDILEQIKNDNIDRNLQTHNVLNNNSDKDMETLITDSNVAIGIAAGYLNLTASLLGYNTGCCQCFDADAIKNILMLKNTPILLMGIGYGDKTVNRRKHHVRKNFMFNVKKKQPIEVSVW